MGYHMSEPNLHPHRLHPRFHTNQNHDGLTTLDRRSPLAFSSCEKWYACSKISAELNCRLNPICSNSSVHTRARA